MFGKDLTEGRVSSHLTNLTIPMFFGMSSMVIAAMVDIVYVGRISPDQLAAMGFCFPIIMISISVSIGFSTAATSIIARQTGSHNHQAVSETATCGLMLWILLSIAYVALIYFIRLPLLELLGAEGAVLQLAISYLEIWLLGYLLFALVMFLTNMLRGTGEAFLPGLVVLLSAVVQAIISPFLIFGLLGVPRLEIEGAAWGFVISRALILGWPLWILGRRFPLLQAANLRLDRIRLVWPEMLRIGIPAVMTNLTGPVSLAVVTIVLASHGSVIIAGFLIFGRIEAISIMVLAALASSIVPFAGQNWASGQFDRAHKSLLLSYRFCLIYGAAAAALLILLADPIISFISFDEGVQQVAWLILLWVAPTFAFLGTAQVSAAVFLALGQARPVFIMGLARVLFVYVPLIWLGNRYFGYVGVFVATALTNALMALIAYWWARVFLSRQRQRR